MLQESVLQDHCAWLRTMRQKAREYGGLTPWIAAGGVPLIHRQAAGLADSPEPVAVLQIQRAWRLRSFRDRYTGSL